MMQLQDDSWHEAPEPPPHKSALDLFQLIKIFRQSKWLVLAITLLGTGAAIYIGAQRTPTYTAAASIIIEPHENQVVDMAAVTAAMPADEFTVATQLKLLTSREHVEQVMDSLHLFDDPAYRPDPETETARSLPFGLDYLIGQALAWLPDKEPLSSPAASSLADHLSPKDAAIEQFSNALEVRQEGKSFVLTVLFTAPDPIKAAAIANRTAALFVDRARADKLKATSEASGWLGERVAVLRDELTKAEGAVEEFRARNGLFYTRAGSVDLDASELAALNNELVRLRTDAANRRATLALIEQKRGGGEDLDEVAEIGASPTILRLRQDEGNLVRREAELAAVYGPRHPNMVTVRGEREKVTAKISQEINGIIQSLNDGLRLMEARQQEIEDQIGSLRARGTQQSQSEIQLRELEREAQASRTLYDTFLQRFKETKEQQALVQPDVRIVSRALPPNAPSSPGPKVFGVIGFTVSFMASTLAALLVARLDKSLREAGQIKSRLGIETICTVPALKLPRGQTPHRYLLDRPLSAYAEAIRSAYLAIRDGLKPDNYNRKPGAHVVLVTSSLPGEGKSTFALSLATLIAQQGHKALIVDLDIRHPSVHRDFRDMPAAGIIEYCNDEDMSWRSIIHEDVTSGLNVIVGQGRGERKCLNPVALMENDRLRAVFRELRLEYDLIVIDSPPLLGVIEARMATAFADAAIFVIGWGKVDVETAQESLQYLRRAQLPVVGAVLTQVHMARQAKYYNDHLAKHYKKFDRYYIN